MNAFQQACVIEERGFASLLPYLEQRAWRGQVILVAKGPLARTFQKAFGDLLVATGQGNVVSVEVKAQRRWTGNLFLEVWSNKNLDDRASHTERGSTPGWLITCRADVVGFHFLDLDAVYFLPLFRLQQWAFGTGETKAAFTTSARSTSAGSLSRTTAGGGSCRWTCWRVRWA